MAAMWVVGIGGPLLGGRSISEKRDVQPTMKEGKANKENSVDGKEAGLDENG